MQNETIFACWQAPDRDSIATLTDPIGDQLQLLLHMEGENGKDDDEVRRVTGQSLIRARRWHLIFERMGLLYTDNNTTRLTDLGRVMLKAEDSYKALRREIAPSVISVLKKYQLKNPVDESPTEHYPEDCDIHPYWVIWKAADELEGRIHWDEVNRELMRVLRYTELDDAIARIRRARQEADYNPIQGGARTVRLRDRCYDQTTAPAGKTPEGQIRDQKMTPWFRRAGFGELLLESLGSGGGGWYKIPDDLQDIIHEAVREHPEFRRFDTEQEWFEYFGSLPNRAELHVDWSCAGQDQTDLCGLIGALEPYLRAVSALKSGKHLILVGPPGTGKTELATCICRKLDVDYDLVTATSDWTTFDTIGGYLPDPRLRDGVSSDQLNFFPGVIPLSLERGRWLVMDEMNRADIDKAFGELFTVLGGRAVRLPFKRREGKDLRDIVLGNSDGPGVHAYRVPEDWRIIGTMNTFDKASLYQLSYAFMRRFAFVNVPVPPPQDYRAILDAQAGQLVGEDGDVTFRDRCMESLGRVFATEENEGLGRLALRIGPAIPIDIIKYLRHRRELATAGSTPAEPRELVLEGLEMYLYPQFEGRDREHDDIVGVIAGALDLDAAARRNTGMRLADWTGFEPSGAEE
jgi:hypothetical protein